MLGSATSTTMSSMEQQLEDITECPICSDSFIDPRSLPCKHTFCLECLERYGQFKEKGTKMACPKCRTELTIPCSGFSGLPKNSIVGTMLQMKKLSIGQNADVCEVCEAKKKKDDPQKSVTAVKFCIECQEKLCMSCSKDHLGHKMLRGHQVIDIDKVRGHESAEVFRTTIATCSKHKDQAMTVFCNDCKTPICVVCYISSHKQHDCSDINDVIDKFRQQMTADVGCLDDWVNKLRILWGSIDQQKQDFIKHVAESKYLIAKKAEELKEQVELNKQILTGELVAREQDISKKLDSLSQAIKQHASFVESLKKYTKELSTKGTVCDIAQEASALHDRVGELLKIDAIEKSRNNMHTIDVKYTETAAVRSISNLVGFVEVQVKSKQVCQPTFTKTLAARISTVCMTSLNDQLFVTCRHSNDECYEARCVFGYAHHVDNYDEKATFEVYDTATFALQRYITVPGLQQVRGLTSCTVNNCLYASDPSTCSIFRVGVPGWITSWRVNSRPTGLSVNTVNNVLVTFTDENCIHEYTPEGSLIRQLSLPHVYSPHHVVQLADGQFVVSYIHGVCIVNVHGHIMSQYSNTSGDPVQIKQPMGLALGENGSVLLADRGLQQIVVFNPSLTNARVLTLPANFELQGPWALHFDAPRGRLYIGESCENYVYSSQNIEQDQREQRRRRVRALKRDFAGQNDHYLGHVHIFDNVLNVGHDQD